MSSLKNNNNGILHKLYFQKNIYIHYFDPSLRIITNPNLKNLPFYFLISH